MDARRTRRQTLSAGGQFTALQSIRMLASASGVCVVAANLHGGTLNNVKTQSIEKSFEQVYKTTG